MVYPFCGAGQISIEGGLGSKEIGSLVLWVPVWWKIAEGWLTVRSKLSQAF
jgi:hypothetical protein